MPDGSLGPSGGFGETVMLQLSAAKRTKPAGQNFLQPAAAKVEAPPRWKWGGQKRNYLPPRPHCPFRRQDARTGRFSQISCGQERRSDQRSLISGSPVRALVRPPPSLPKPRYLDLRARRPLLRPFLARGGLRFPVSAQRYRLQVPFGASVSGGRNPVPGSRLTTTARESVIHVGSSLVHHQPHLR